ncbi:unnamed protein product [Blepharisma stoltei]|uniref:Uncharacterized protein n=1 Tax=Blepharisma stoltei TaxID=1481888 RepID=A0AAU9JWH9_9CILI|nr:unnamed protein product [Blepharisma stoltei]
MVMSGIKEVGLKDFNEAAVQIIFPNDRVSFFSIGISTLRHKLTSSKFSMLESSQLFFQIPVICLCCYISINALLLKNFQFFTRH